jgi:TolA-binding protein
MKRSERHRLKENELSHVLRDASATLSENRRSLGLIGGVVVLALVAGGGYWAWKTRTESRARILLSDAMVILQAPVEEGKPGAKPGGLSYPTVRARTEAALGKLGEAFTAYPSTEAGIAARYHAAAALSELGRPAEAAARYQEVVDHAGAGSFYGRMGQLGLVQANADAKKYDQAISAAQALVNNTSDETIPRDALLLQLGRVQAAAGKKAEAKQTLDKVIAEFPDSPFIEEAKRIIAELT